jgi:ABC-2 type transport system ATP-binding protein
MAAISIEGLEKSYAVGFFRKKLKTGLKPLVLQVEDGETFGFLGPNGAGKTTTLKLLMGLIFPTAGTASILGMHFHDPRVKSQIGFLPEQPYFYDHLSATELLDYYARLSGLSAAERKRRIPMMLERVGLQDAGKLQLRKFSKGMLQRAGIAQAILHDPRIVFLDEPMSGLDPMGRREVREIIESLKQERKTVFFSTHILSDAEALCDRVAVLHQGELRGVGVVADLKTKSATQVDVVWDGSQAIAAVAALGGDCHATGETVRAVVGQDRLDATLEAIRRAGGRLVSVNPVQNTLEEYFLERLRPAEVAK